MSSEPIASVDAATPAHRWPVRVYYEDTDAAGIVYHAQYLAFAERARTELLRTLGLDHPTLIARHGGQFVVRRCVVDFVAPARLDDLLEVATSVLEARGARLLLEQRVVKGERLLARLEVGLAFLDARLRPVRLPEPVRAAFLVHRATR